MTSTSSPTPEALAAARDRELLDEAVGLLYRCLDPVGDVDLVSDVRALIAAFDARPSDVPPEEAPDLNLLRALAGEGGRRTGALRRLGYLTWSVTPAGYRALGMKPPQVDEQGGAPPREEVGAREMTDAETADHLRRYVAAGKGLPFAWPTDACGYHQHIRFVQHRNAHWHGEGSWDDFVIEYANLLSAGTTPKGEPR